MDKLPRRIPSGPHLHLPDKQISSFRHKLRRWLRSRKGRIIMPLLGVLVGIIVTLLVLSSISSNPPLSSPDVKSSQQGAITVSLSKNYLTGVINRNLASSTIPGKITNVQLRLTPTDRMTITGDDTVSGVLGLGVSRPFMIIAQTTVQACQPHIHILSVTIGEIPVTGVAESFESQINQSVMVSPSSLPPGFMYCAISLHTQSQGLDATFSATPIS
ncbi:MAG TPA: hypothetical protein VFN23_12500 [Ktedonobacteraceae bacterium]|nr:hypothetical protein [Ktedonobacteraceae bacterium]